MICLEPVFFISFLSSSGANGVINKGCVVAVAVEACSFILGRSLATSCALFSSEGESRCWKRWWPTPNLKQCQLRGLRVSGPFIQIRSSGDDLVRVFWGSEELVWLFLYFLR